MFARTAFDEVRAAASASASAGYFDKMLIGFTDLKAQTEKAADAAGKIADGAGKLKSGAQKEATGTTTRTAAPGSSPAAWATPGGARTNWPTG